MKKLLSGSCRTSIASVLVLLYLLRLVIPYGNYILLPYELISFVLAFSFVFDNKRRIFSIKSFACCCFIPLIILLFLLGYFLLTFDHQKILTIDIIHSVNSFVVIFIMYMFLVTKEDLHIFFNRLGNLIIVSAVIVAFIGQAKLLLQLKGVELGFQIDSKLNSSLTMDPNFFSLFLLLSVVLLIRKLSVKTSQVKSIVFQSFMLISVVCVCLTGSRRGILAMSSLCLVMFVLFILSFFCRRGNNIFVNFRKNLYLFVPLFALISLSFFYFLVIMSPTNRNKIILKMPFPSKISYYLSSILYQANSILFDDVKYSEVRYKLIQDKFDPRYPYCGWALGDYTIVDKIEGQNFEIVPREAKGCLVDARTNVGLWHDQAHYSLVPFYGISTYNMTYRSSVFCYVSEDFNGDYVSISSRPNVHRFAYYDLLDKGKWKKLTTYFKGGECPYEVWLQIVKNNSISFDSLQGHVVFAYPQIDSMPFNPGFVRCYAPDNNFEIEDNLIGDNVEIVPAESEGIKFNCTAKGAEWQTIYYTAEHINLVNTIKGDSVKSSIYCYQSFDFNGCSRVEAHGKEGVLMHRCKYYDSSKKAQWQKLEAKALSNGGEFDLDIFFSKSDAKDYSLLTGHVIFAYPEISVKRNGKWLSYLDLIDIEYDKQQLAEQKKLEEAERLAEESIRYTSDEVQFGDFSNVFSGPRVERWKYAWYIYTKEYNWRQRIIGNGFGYTRKFADMFKDDDGFDYPHNPMLSVLLYSGIIGLLMYFYMLFLVFKYYWKYRKRYWPWAVCFLITFFFSFFSANGPFEPAVMGFFILLPFLFKLLDNTDSKVQVENK